MQFAEIIQPGTTPQLVADGFGFTEGPAADAAGNVYFSDGRHDAIYFYPVGGSVVRWTDDSPDANGMMLNSRGELYVCEGAAYRVVAYDLVSKNKRVLCHQIEGQHFNEPNDLAIDFTDGFYFSDPNYQHRGQPTVMKEDVYYCSAAGEVKRVSTVCFKPNGVLLSADDRTLYVADARGQRIFRYDVLAPGQLANERLWIDRLGANPDGLTLDEYNNLYVCCGKAGVKIFDAQGSYLGTIAVPAANACFGGPDFKTLFLAAGDKFFALPTEVVGLRPLPLRNPQQTGCPSQAM